MSITNELRDWFKDRMFMANGWQEIHDIADRIDAEHEAKVSYWQGASYKDGYDEGFASADDWLGQHEDAMAEHGWVRLPKDADGVPIRVGDILAGEKAGGFGLCEPFEVGCILFGRDIIQVNDVHGLTRCAEFAHHCRPDSWERIIEDAVNVHGNGFNPCWTDKRDALVARCKALCERTNGGDVE